MKCAYTTCMWASLVVLVACGHERAPVVEEPTAEQPETETVAQDAPNPACAEAVVCEGEYEYDGEILSGFSITSAEQLTELRRCRSISGDLRFDGQEWLTRIDLPCLTDIGGSLTIINNPALTSLEGLSTLTDIGGNLSIVANNALTSLEGLQGITQVGGGLSIVLNRALTSLEGLQNITQIGGELFIYRNPALTSLEGLQGITEVGGGVGIASNPALTSLAGLRGITEVGGEMDIWDNATIPEFNNLESLRAYLRTNAP